MAIDSNLDIGADCDSCGQHANVMVDTWVSDRLRERGWSLNTTEGDLCPCCVARREDGDE